MCNYSSKWRMSCKFVRQFRRNSVLSEASLLSLTAMFSSYRYGSCRWRWGSACQAHCGVALQSSDLRFSIRLTRSCPASCQLVRQDGSVAEVGRNEEDQWTWLVGNDGLFTTPCIWLFIHLYYVCLCYYSYYIQYFVDCCECLEYLKKVETFFRSPVPQFCLSPLQFECYAN